MDGRKIPFDSGWKFTDKEPPLTSRYVSNHLSYVTTRCGERCPISKNGFDDSGWKKIDVPHDWMVGVPYDKDALASHGHQKMGYAWYRKDFVIDASLRGRQFILVFGGIAGNSEIYFNGSLMKRNFSSFNEITVDITDRVFFDRPNSIAVFVDRSDIELWAYEGAGIYRHVWLYVKDGLNIENDGIYACPEKIGESTWTIPIEVTVGNSFYSEKSCRLYIGIFDASGNEIAETSLSCAVQPRSSRTVKAEFQTESPSLWELDSPVLYTARVTVVGENIYDSDEVCFGFRTFCVGKDSGFVLNGHRTTVNAVCLHQNFAGVGAALTDSIIDYRLRKVKGLGANGIRCSHQNMAREFYDWCDRNGMIVIDENRNFESDEYHLSLLREQTVKNRNHPSVMFLMIYNEEPIAKDENGVNIFNSLKFEFRKFNSKAIITAAMCDKQHLSANGVAPLLDVTGINYQLETYGDFEKLFPNQPIIGSENVAENASRGYYKNEDFRLSDLDENYVQGLFNNIRDTFRTLSEHPSSCGLMTWSAFDYRGETCPFDWPSVTSYFGLHDICGFEKGIADFFRVYSAKKPFLKIIQNMNHENGEIIRAATVSNCDEVELFLNGKSLGKRRNNIYEQHFWEFTFEKGTLLAFGYNDGTVAVSDKIETTGKPSKLVLSLPEGYESYKGDIVPVTVYAVDGKGRRVPDASLRVDFECSNGKISACSNGDQLCHESELIPSRNLHMGYALVLVRTPREGKVRLKAKSKSTDSVEIEF